MMFRYLLIGFCSLASLLAQAETPRPGNEGGAGGHGLLVDGKPYLMDLVEAGVSKNPYVDKTRYQAPGFKALKATLVDKLGEEIDEAAIELLAAKLLEVHAMNQGLAYSLLASIRQLLWQAPSEDLFEVDLPEPVLKVGDRQVMLALRRDLVVRMNRKHVARMDAANVAALVIHEALYAMTPPMPATDDGPKSGHYTMPWQQEGKHCRLLTGILFSKKIKDAMVFDEAAKMFPTDRYVTPLDPTGSRVVTEFSFSMIPTSAPTTCQRGWPSAVSIGPELATGDFLAAACPTLSDTYYAACAPKPYLSIAWSRVEAGSYHNRDRKMSQYVNVARGATAYYVPDLKGAGESTEVLSRAACVDFARKAYEKAKRDRVGTGIFD